MKTKHTPGPWQVMYDDKHDHIFTVRKHRRRIANIFGGVWGQNESDLENQANARLIAAAPELLEALLEVMEDGLKTNMDSWRREANAAITKATGESS